ncbi:hypothetical protein MCAP1_003389 [Malassezia caprae]|uniref:Urea active transporter 1 n=1 Tax=Malassezia caprae TaxID=1381934 RepID=A0AAF0E7C9_9BASI|nr:hypothetical protein MCAP1_003389 [Malassezia caprae]
MTLCLINNLIAVVNMLLGASAAISALTGMHIVASIFLLPLGVCLYTISGGLRATFLTDWAHTIALFIIVLYLPIKTLTSPVIGSLHDLWNTVNEAARKAPVSGNYMGSYLTMTSPSAVEFGIIHTLNASGLVIMDSSYWQKAYSANMAAAVPGYLLGGVVYFGLPWCLGSIMGLGSLALRNTPLWPAFGRELSTKELNAGLILPYAGMAVAGKAGAVAVVLVVFMAVTSTMSAELIAVSSIISSDVYHTYVKRDASGKQIMFVSHLACVGFALVGCAVSMAFYYAGISLTWTVYFLGVITCPGMITMPLTVLWRRQSKGAAILSPVLGMAGGLATWLASARQYGHGVVSLETTGMLLPCLWGTIVSAVVPALSTVILSFVFPSAPFHWAKFEDMELMDGSTSTSADLEEKAEAGSPVDFEFPEDPQPRRVYSVQEEQYMRKMSLVSGIAGVVLFLVVWIIWPLSMYGSGYIFQPKFFSGWLVVSVIWVFVGLLVVLFLPPLDDHLLLHAPDGVGRALLEQTVPLGRRWLQVLPRFGALSLQDYDMSILRHDRVRDMLYSHVQRNAHVEVEREAFIVLGRQDRSDLLVWSLHAGPESETHYDLFIREVDGSSKERNGCHEVALKPTGRPHE